jgi:hypothetical protein
MPEFDILSDKMSITVSKNCQNSKKKKGDLVLLLLSFFWPEFLFYGQPDAGPTPPIGVQKRMCKAFCWFVVLSLMMALAWSERLGSLSN